MQKDINGAEFLNAHEVLEWTPIAGLPGGAWEKILYVDEDSGTYARFVKLDEGFENTKGVPLEHEFDELVFIFSGETTFPRLGHSYKAPSLGLFPIGAKHGPYSAPGGSLAIEFRHYPKSASGKRSFPTLDQTDTTGAEFADALDVLEWTPIAGLPGGAWEKILYVDEDSGTYARFVKLDEGFENTKGVPLEHEFDELVFIFSGETTFPRLGHSYKAPSLGLFPIGAKHGPYSAPGGSLAIEFRHYPKSASGKRSFPTLK